MDFITLNSLKSFKLINDVLLYPLKINRDASGVLVETLRVDWKGIYGKGREFVMQYYSITQSGLARDEDVWHYHPTGQEDRFLLVQGAIVVAVADNRQGSSTHGLLNLFYIQADRGPYILLIPKRTLHAFMVVSDNPAIMLNYPTRLYNPAEEGRIPFKDAKVALADKKIFTWEKVRQEFPKFYSSINAQH